MDLLSYSKLGFTIIYPLRLRFLIGIGIGITCSFAGSLVHYHASAMYRSVYNNLPFMESLIFILFFNTISGIASLLRGHIFTRINADLYALNYRRFFKNICYASTEIWDRDFKIDELSKCALSDIKETINTASLTLNVLSRNLTTIAFVGWTLSDISLELTIICAAICVFQVWCAHIANKYLSTHVDKSNSIRMEQEAHVNEFIQKHIELQLYSLQSVYLDVFDTRSEMLRNAIINEAYAYAALIFNNHIIPKTVECGFICSIYYFGYSSKVLEAIAYYAIVCDALNGIKDILLSFVRTKDSALRAKNYLINVHTHHIDSSIVPNSINSSQITNSSGLSITFEQISFAYPTRIDKQVFSKFSLHVEPFDKWAIVAKSGCGKTTLLKLLLNMYSVSNGVIKIGSRPVQDIGISELRKLVSIVPQEPIFFPMKTLQENMVLTMQKTQLPTKEELITILQRVQLGEFSDQLNVKVAALSGGQKQRLAIARVLLANTPIVIFDEPTSALDEENTALLIKEIELHCQEKTVLFITHNKKLIAPYMRVLHL